MQFLYRLVCAFFLFEGGLATATFAQSVNVGGGAAISLGAGTLNTGCGDIAVSGSGIFSVDSGSAIGNRHVNIAGGTINGGSGLISLSGDWTNSGTFNAGSGLVDIVDGCGTSASIISGNSSFARFNVASSVGRLLTAAAGATQQFSQSLALNGVSGNRVLVRSSTPGVATNFVLQSGASQSIDWVDVADNDASGGETIAPDFPESFNSVDSGGVLNWFRRVVLPRVPQQIDTLPLPALLMLILALAYVARSQFMRRSSRTLS
jgi:hypothetical protein